MAAINKQAEVTTIGSNDWLVADILQPDGNYKTKKLRPSVVGTGLNYIPEDVANKSTDGTLASNSDTLYPTEQAVKTYVDANGAPAALTQFDGLAIDTFELYSAGSITTLDQGVGWAADGVAENSTIVSRTNADGSAYNAIAIANGQIGRQFAWGELWNRIQIYIAWRINASASFQGDGYFGFCSGVTNMVASASTDNFIGMRFENTTNPNPTYAAGTKNGNFLFNPSLRFVTRRGTTTTDRLSGSGGTARYIGAGEGYHSFALLDISRPVFATDSTSVTYNMAYILDGAAPVEFSKSKAGLLLGARGDISTTLASTLTMNTMTASTPTTASGFSFDQSTGVFDAFNISWPFANALEISCIAIRKVH